MSEGPFGFDGGEAPVLDEAPEGPLAGAHDEAGGAPLDEGPPLALEPVAEVDPDEAGAFLHAIFFGLHVTLGAGGPPDAFLPTDQELAGMARPLASWSSRHQRAAAIVKRGDGFAFASSFGTFVVRETKRTADYRRAAKAQEQDAAADAAFPGIHADAPPPRRWRPAPPQPEAA